MSADQPTRIVPKSVVVSEGIRTELKQYLCYPSELHDDSYPGQSRPVHGMM